MYEPTEAQIHRPDGVPTDISQRVEKYVLYFSRTIGFPHLKRFQQLLDEGNVLQAAVDWRDFPKRVEVFRKSLTPGMLEANILSAFV